MLDYLNMIFQMQRLYSGIADAKIMNDRKGGICEKDVDVCLKIRYLSTRHFTGRDTDSHCNKILQICSPLFNVLMGNIFRGTCHIVIKMHICSSKHCS
jgi:hypothetical protein